MITSLILSAQFIVGIVKRLIHDAYYRSISVVLFLFLLIGALFAHLVGKWPLFESILYAVTTMSMNTPYKGPHIEAAGPVMEVFHMFYTFLSVGSFLIFAMETGKTMLMTYEETVNKRAERKAMKAAAKAATAEKKSKP